MKKTIILSVLISATIFGLRPNRGLQQTCFAYAGEASPMETKEAQNMQYVTYAGKDPMPKVGFQYPSGWKLKEEQGRTETYSQVRILGKRNPDDTYTCYIAVIKSPLKNAGGRYESVDEFYEQYKARFLEGTKIVSDSNSEVAQTDSRDMVISYVMPPPFQHGLKPIEIPIRTRTLVFIKGQDFYQIIFSADEREYASLENVFSKLLETFKFID